MKRYTWVLSLLPVAVLAGFIMARSVKASSEDINGGSGHPLDITLANATRGQVWGTAAINPDATVASCFACNKSTTLHLGTGVYQVGFSLGNITATNGFSRWVQVDTLSTGVISNIVCNTADRAGVTSAVFVTCGNTSGALVDTSFFLFVAR